MEALSVRKWDFGTPEAAYKSIKDLEATLAERDAAVAEVNSCDTSVCLK